MSLCCVLQDHLPPSSRSFLFQRISHAKLRLAAKGVGPQPDRSASSPPSLLSCFVFNRRLGISHSAPDRFLHSYDALEIFSIFRDE